MLTLDLAIATHRPEGIARLADMVLPPVSGVRYVVSWQNHAGADIPDSLMRDDVDIYRYDGEGQSANRNNALARCSGDIVLNSDDDLILYEDGLLDLIRIFECNPDVVVATFRSEHGDMSRFPKEETKLSTHYPKGYYVGAIEIAFRRERIGTLRFCEEFGLGSKYLHGEEDEMFLYSAVKRGLDCRFFPITICAHPHESTGLKANMTSANLRAAGCMMALCYPLTFLPRVILKAWRLKCRNQAHLFKAMSCMLMGCLMAPGVLCRNHASLW